MPQIPNIVFIVPYRNRPQHKYFFSNYLTTIMGFRDDYEIYFSHQNDTRPFNRGGTKNIGFLAIKHKYPEHYKDITFVFNDIDTIPFSTIFNYETTHGIIKHFYGFNYALGGIFSIKGSDFEATNGFPNFWGWGMEDTVLHKRVDKIGLVIDRTDFFPIGSPNIIHLFDGVSRIINQTEPVIANHDDGKDGLRTINKLHYTIDDESNNSDDNTHIIISDKIFVININTFITNIHFDNNNNNYYLYDLREPPNKMIQTQHKKNITDITNNNDWTIIPNLIQQQHTQIQDTNYNKLQQQIQQQLQQINHTKQQQLQQIQKQQIQDINYKNPYLKQQPIIKQQLKLNQEQINSKTTDSQK
jgi:hypothetical protein